MDPSIETALRTWLPLLLPLVLLQLGLQIAAIYDLVRRERELVRGGNKWVWAAVIVLGEAIGPLAYFLLGRKE